MIFVLFTATDSPYTFPHLPPHPQPVFGTIVHKQHLLNGLMDHLEKTLKNFFLSGSMNPETKRIMLLVPQKVCV